MQHLTAELICSSCCLHGGRTVWQCCIKYILKVFQLQNTNYIFKLYLKYFSQLLLKSSTKYKIPLAKVIEIQNTFHRTYAKTF